MNNQAMGRNTCILEYASTIISKSNPIPSLNSTSQYKSAAESESIQTVYVQQQQQILSIDSNNNNNNNTMDSVNASIAHDNNLDSLTSAAVSIADSINDINDPDLQNYDSKYGPIHRVNIRYSKNSKILIQDKDLIIGSISADNNGGRINVLYPKTYKRCVHYSPNSCYSCTIKYHPKSNTRHIHNTNLHTECTINNNTTNPYHHCRRYLRFESILKTKTIHNSLINKTKIQSECKEKIENIDKETEKKLNLIPNNLKSTRLVRSRELAIDRGHGRNLNKIIKRDQNHSVTVTAAESESINDSDNTDSDIESVTTEFESDCATVLAPITSVADIIASKLEQSTDINNGIEKINYNNYSNSKEIINPPQLQLQLQMNYYNSINQIQSVESEDLDQSLIANIRKEFDSTIKNIIPQNKNKNKRSRSRETLLRRILINQ